MDMLGKRQVLCAVVAEVTGGAGLGSKPDWARFHTSPMVYQKATYSIFDAGKASEDLGGGYRQISTTPFLVPCTMRMGACTMWVVPCQFQIAGLTRAVMRPRHVRGGGRASLLSVQGWLVHISPKWAAQTQHILPDLPLRAPDSTTVNSSMNAAELPLH